MVMAFAQNGEMLQRIMHSSMDKYSTDIKAFIEGQSNEIKVVNNA